MGEPKQSTIKIDPATNDIAIPFTIITGYEALAQRLNHRFQFFFREWFLDLRQGAPYYEYVFIKNPNERIIRVLLRQIIESTPEVLRVVNDKFTYDQRKRTLTYNELEIETTDGEVYRFQPDTFIVRLPIPGNE